MVVCRTCNGRMTPVGKEVIEKSRLRRDGVGLDGKRHYHSGDRSITIWSCPHQHDIIVNKPIQCWCGWGRENAQA